MVVNKILNCGSPNYILRQSSNTFYYIQIQFELSSDQQLGKVADLVIVAERWSSTYNYVASIKKHIDTDQMTGLHILGFGCCFFYSRK